MMNRKDVRKIIRCNYKMIKSLNWQLQADTDYNSKPAKAEEIKKLVSENLYYMLEMNNITKFNKEVE